MGISLLHTELYVLYRESVAIFSFGWLNKSEIVVDMKHYFGNNVGCCSL